MKTFKHKAAVTFLSNKAIKDLRKSIHQLERDKQKILQSMHEIERKMGHDEKIYRSEKLSELDHVDSEIAYKKLILENSKTIPRKRSHLQVVLGSVVDLIDRQGHRFHYKLVDSIEANPSEGRISIVSPIGKSLIGHNVKDIIKWTAKDKIHKLKLVEIH